MIRFINLFDQILEDEFQFAWFDTVCDKFIEIEGCYVWSSWSEFSEDFKEFGIKDKSQNFTLDRFKRLFPKHTTNKHGIINIGIINMTDAELEKKYKELKKLITEYKDLIRRLDVIEDKFYEVKSELLCRQHPELRMC